MLEGALLVGTPSLHLREEGVRHKFRQNMAGLLLVLLKVGLLLEGTTARAALEGTLVGVRSQVHLKVGFALLGEVLATNGTVEDLLGNISVLGPQRSRGQQHTSDTGGCGGRRP